MSEDNGFGHNSGDTGDETAEVLSDGQRKSIFVQHLKAVREQKKKLETVTSGLRTLFKKAKADGVTKKELDFALALQGDDGVMLEQRRKEAEIAAWLNHPIGTQFSFLDEPDRTPLEDRAYIEGELVGMEGSPARSPYEGAAEQAWLRGYADGQQTFNSALDLKKAGVPQIKKEAKAKAKSEGAPKKRGRPKGSANKPKEGSYSEKLAEHNAATDEALKGGDPFEEQAAA